MFETAETEVGHPIIGTHVPWCNARCSAEDGHWLDDEDSGHAHEASLREQCSECLDKTRKGA